ncbi:MAG: PEP-CTERM sorting domain-containing protein [Massilia sp.]
MLMRKKFTKFMLMAACAWPLTSMGGPRYALTVLGGADSAALDINQSGQVVGQYTNADGAQRAFLHSGGVLQDLGTLGGNSSSATAINNGGQIVGVADNGDGYGRAFSYAHGVMSDLGTLGGLSSRAYGLDNDGHIVGSADTPEGEIGQYGAAFLLSGGVMTNLGFLPTYEGDEMSRALAINGHGLVVGASSATLFGPPEHPEHAFTYTGGVLTDLGTFGGLYSAARSINDGGVIVGQASTTLDPAGIGHTVPHAFMYIHGMMIDLGALGDEYDGSDAHDVNNLDDIVGSTGIRGSDGPHGFLYQAGVLQDLNNLIDSASGWVVTSAAAINDGRQIAATACRVNLCYAVRLDPLVAEVPEPGAAFLTATGLALLAGVILRRRSRQFSRS